MLLILEVKSMTQAGAKSLGSNFTLLDYVMKNFGTITISEFTRIRNTGTDEEIAEAVARMEAAGGYDCLED